MKQDGRLKKSKEGETNPTVSPVFISEHIRLLETFTLHLTAVIFDASKPCFANHNATDCEIDQGVHAKIQQH